MITDTIKLLHTEDFYGLSEFIEIAKGKYELPKSIKIGRRKIKLAWHVKRKLK